MSTPLNVADWRAEARRRLPRFVFDYVDGGAEDDVALTRNRAAFERVALAPRTLRDTTRVDASIELFGQRWAMPVAAAPTGFNGLLRRCGDTLLARAAAAAGIPFTLSTASNDRLEDVRRGAAQVAPPQAPAPWLQLYVMSDRAIAQRILARARDAGYGALVLTVDVPVSGRRERDLRNGFRLPFRPGPSTMLDLLAHPRWLAGVARHGAPAFVNLADGGGGQSSAQLQAALLARAMDRSLAWRDLQWLRRQWDGPILVKGLLHPDDAQRAREHGADGIVVSNHGGRQLDAAPAPIEMLPAVVDAAGPALPVLLDSGVRRGVDVARALALGARAVLVGRPLLWGLAARGEAGASAVLAQLRDEFLLAMTLLGASDVGQIDRGLLAGPLATASPSGRAAPAGGDERKAETA